MRRRMREEKAALLHRWSTRGVAAKVFRNEKGPNYSACMKWKRSEEESILGNTLFIEVVKRGRVLCKTPFPFVEQQNSICI